MIIGEALARTVATYGDKTALKDMYGKYFPVGYSLTYRELDEATNRLANHLLALGLTPGDRVSVQTGTGAGHVLSLLALAKAGMAIAPIDRTYTADEIVYQATDAGSRAFIVDADIYRERIDALAGRILTAEHFIVIGEDIPDTLRFETLIAEGPISVPALTVNEDDLLTLIYTSGTTGRAKGVPLTHRNWWASACAWATELGISPHWNWLLVMPVHTSGGTGLSLVACLRGCTLILSDPVPAKILQLIEDEKVSFTQFSPTLLANVIHHENAETTNYGSIERWFTSAAPISAALLSEGASFLGEKFTQLYGTTETALLGTVLRPEDVSVSGGTAARLTSVGRACWGFRARVVDDDGNEVGPGGSGELAIGGDAVGTGYWNRPDADDFRDGWWYSGDIVRVDEEGFLYVIDRKKDMILSGGTNIYPREVEDVLSAHPAIHIVAVVGVPDEKWGEAVKAVVVLRKGQEVTGDEIMEWCRDKMASYKKPKSVDVVDLSEMPLMGGGYKVLRRELRDRYRRRFEEEKKSNVSSWGAV
jgi:long-chain acyl-CoA synthetase